MGLDGQAGRQADRQADDHAAGQMRSSLEIADLLRRQIESGVFSVNSRLPAQQALAARYKVSRTMIQNALTRLRADGYISSRQGSGTFVSERAVGSSPTERAQGSHDLASSKLGSCLRQAFLAEHVTIDLCSLSAETLNLVLGREAERIRALDRETEGNRKGISPRSVTVRALLADPDSDLLVGEPADDLSDRRPRERIASLLRTHASYLNSCFAIISDQRAEPEISIQIRTLATTPVMKTYLLNGTELLYGHYKFIRMADGQREGYAAHYDALGLDSTLFHYSSVGQAEDTATVALIRHTQEWFDSLWQTVAKPSRL